MYNTAFIATSCQPALLVKYLESYLSDLERWLSEWRIVINVLKHSARLFANAGRRIPKPRPTELFREPIQWVVTARYLGATINKRLPWSTHIDQVRKKAAHRLGELALLDSRSSLFIWNGVLLYKQLICPMMNYECHVWRPAACSHIRKMQALHSKCLCIATIDPWYIGNRQIHNDLGVPYFNDHIRSLRYSTES